MYRLLKFLRRYYALFLFIVLEGAAVNYYINSTSYTRAKMYSASNYVTGGMQSLLSSVGDYFSLRRDNMVLVERLARAEEMLTAYEGQRDTAVVAMDTKYRYSTARVVSNSVTRQHNYFVVDRGRSSSVGENMAVLSVDGSVAGYVQAGSDKYAVCMSILNRDFRVGGKIKGKDYFGSVTWDGVSPRFVTLSDIPRYAPLEKGDTIVSAYSSRFPPDSHIGTIESYREAGDGTYFEIKVRLGVDMMALSDVMLVRFTDTEELNELGTEYFPDSQ